MSLRPAWARVRPYPKKPKTNKQKTHFHFPGIPIKYSPVLFCVFARPGPEPKERPLTSQSVAHTPGNNVSFKHRIPELFLHSPPSATNSYGGGGSGTNTGGGCPATVQPGQGLYTRFR
jgi:hypothetical protein